MLICKSHRFVHGSLNPSIQTSFSKNFRQSNHSNLMQENKCLATLAASSDPMNISNTAKKKKTNKLNAMIKTKKISNEIRIHL